MVYSFMRLSYMVSVEMLTAIPFWVKIEIAGTYIWKGHAMAMICA